MLRTLFVGLVVMGLAASSQAAVIISAEASPTVGIAGSTTFKLIATAEAGEKIIGFDFVGDGSLGFSGLMNHVIQPPFVTSAVWEDSNAFFPLISRDVSQDSQFSVLTTEGLALNGSESATSLKGAFAFSQANALLQTNVLQFAQLSIPNAGEESIVSYTGNFTVQGPTGDPFLVDVSGRVPASTTPEIPEPSTIALVGLALVGLIGYNRRK